MFLYDMKEKTLNIYKLTSDIQAMKNYRLKEMEKISEDKRMFIAQGFLSGLIPPLFEFEFDDPELTFSMEEVSNGFIHKLKVENPIKGSSMITLASYISGELRDRPVVKIEENDKIRYFLLANDKYEKDNHYNGKVMKGIIEIPESLYLLQLLQQEKFKLVGDKNVKKQLSLYKIISTEEVSLDMIKKTSSYVGKPDAYQEILAKAEVDKNILKYVKR